MAVYTPVSENELTEFVANYGIGKLISYEGIEAGVSNTNYHIFTEQGRYILTLFEPHRVRAEDIPFYLEYIRYLERGGVPCANALVRQDGASLGYLADRPAAIFEFLQGEGQTASSITPEKCRRAGETLAQMHKAALSMPDTLTNQFALPKWQSWVGAIGAHMDSIQSGLFQTVTSELTWLQNAWPYDLPRGAIHADYFPDNVFFTGNELTGVIDFHFVCTDDLAYDLAIAVNAWSFDAANNFVPERMQHMMDGYTSVRPLTPAEQAAMPLMLRAGAFRFLISRIEEKLRWKQGDMMIPHDPLVFLKRLKTFQDRFSA